MCLAKYVATFAGLIYILSAASRYHTLPSLVTSQEVVMKQSLLVSVLVCTLLPPVLGQQPGIAPQQKTQPPLPGTEEVVRITTNLVQIDAVVTDRRGQQIIDLGPEEFEVYEDGRRQQLTIASGVGLQLSLI
ncbi:MAG TPA: hypothetical protein DHU55_13130, partial [Blastocatellia bacterium]|nr:hypothetical protein [Blastocatellia bacterium]